jgi:hypothetical protein
MSAVRRVFAMGLLATARAATAAGAEGAVEFKLDTTLTLGTTVRTEAASPEQYAFIPSSTVNGAAPGQLTGQTGGSDLNFRRGRPVSTVTQGMFDLTVSARETGLGLFARAAAWHDFTLGHAGAGYGNFSNGYATGAPLSDAGLQRGARFDGLMLRDVYAFGAFDLGQARRLELRLGRQVLGADGTQGHLSANWGGARLIAGGIASALNPQDLVAQQRPGALAEEARVPVGMLSLHLAAGTQWSFDAFLPWETREAVLPACGTFFDIMSVAPPGCALGSAIPYTFAGTPVASIASLTEKSLLGSGLYLRRLPEEVPSGRGQFGLAAHVLVAPLRTEVALYALNTPVTLPYFRARIDDVRGAPVSVGLGGPAGLVFSALQRLNPWVSQLPPGLAAAYTPPAAGQGNGLEYGVTYPRSVRLYGLSFNTEASAATRLYGELAWRPNQPLSYNLNDLLNALLLRTPTALLAERRQLLAAPAGAYVEAFDRLGVATASLGMSQTFSKAWGSAALRLSAELGISHVNDLPDPQTLRYGRAFAYGSAPYRDAGTGALSNCAQPANGAGLYFAPGKTCTTDGFITSSAWGLRATAAGVYPNALLGATLTPSLLLGWDLRGYAYDGTFSAGRRLIRPGLRAGWMGGFWTELAYTRISGGRYNLLADRDNLAVAIGMKF